MYMRLLRRMLFFALLFAALSACGELRFSQVEPGIGDFHPEKICVFPVDTGAYAEVAELADNLIADAVSKRGFFSGVVSPEDAKKLMENDARLKSAVFDYLAKLKKVNFSDPDISSYIGKTCGIDAILVVDVDFWNYTTQGNDKIAKVGFSMELIEAQTGKIMWRAKHYDTTGYNWIKPDLADLAKEVAEEMVSHMPR
ncbi:MAG: hypothetical protein JRC66_00220 [Deltaproteobacteria bacterium]|nr:hypothetical protein [Deltaproteobacteria bacterium]